MVKVTSLSLNNITDTMVFGVIISLLFYYCNRERAEDGAKTAILPLTFTMMSMDQYFYRGCIFYYRIQLTQFPVSKYKNFISLYNQQPPFCCFTTARLYFLSSINIYAITFVTHYFVVFKNDSLVTRAFLTIHK